MPGYGVDHRDIKPANLGVREQPSDRAKHLVLFDFSLARASAATTSAGTPPYLDPFLGSGAREVWDSAAERYAATATLFEMATGHTPVYGDGQSDPASIPDEATVEPGDFDPAVADDLVGFFQRALSREVWDRFGTAAEMLSAWRAALQKTTSTTPEDADETSERVTVDTPLAQSGLTPRALSALEPFRLATVGDLAALDTGRLSRFTGIVVPRLLCREPPLAGTAVPWLLSVWRQGGSGGGKGPHLTVLDLALTREVVRRLHRQPGTCRPDASLLQTDCEPGTHTRVTVQDPAQGDAIDAQPVRCLIDGDIQAREHVLADDLARVHGVLHAHGAPPQ